MLIVGKRKAYGIAQSAMLGMNYNNKSSKQILLGGKCCLLLHGGPGPRYNEDSMRDNRLLLEIATSCIGGENVEDEEAEGFEKGKKTCS